MIELIDRLLEEAESTSLDFKRDAYPFENATDHAKSELLKDILAFANAWRRSDAYILIGVDATAGRPRVVGVARHPDDAQLQQFVCGKTQRPLEFSYRVVDYGGEEIGVIHIPVQPRPFFLKKAYGRLAANVVYVRRGSSTAEADPDEIAKMGVAGTSATQLPALEMGFASFDGREWLGQELRVEPAVLKPKMFLARHQGFNLGDRHWKTGIYNDEYHREVSNYVWHRAIARPARVAVRNPSSSMASDVLVEIDVPTHPELLVLDSEQFPERPDPMGLRSVSHHLAGLAGRHPDLRVLTVAGGWRIEATLARCRPGSVVITESPVYLGSTKPVHLKLTARILSRELRPVETALTVELAAVRRPMTYTDVQEFAVT